jgi:lipopolysaccharide export system protein LptA
VIGMRVTAALCAALAAAALLAGAGAAQELAAAPAAAAPAAAKAPAGPVRVSADAAEYFNAEGLAVFTGSVVATQADATLTAERMEVRFTKPEGGAAGAASPLGGAQAGRRVASVTALKSVTFRQLDAEAGKERFATGEKGVYDADARTVTMTGSPRLWEEKNVVVGEEMVFFLDEKRVLVKGKVNLTVYPGERPAGAPGK